MKGKKFDAAEKHFQKERLKLTREIALNRAELDIAYKDNESLLEERDRLLRENIELKAQVAKLLEYEGLSKDEIKTACQKDMMIAETLGFLKGRFGFNY